MGDGNATLRFYYPLPVFGEKMSRQWPKFREDFQNLAPLVRAAYIDLQPSSMHDPGENDLSGWAVGERDFRNRWRIWYSKTEDMFKIQYNVGTEDVPAWVDAMQIRNSDLRVTITGPGGIAAPTGGFYTDIPRQLAITQNFPLSSEWQFQHNLDTVPIIWDTFRSNNISVVPAKVDVGDPNIAYFYFNVPVAGKAIAVGGQARGNGINFTDGTNIYYNKLQLNVNSNDFYLSRNLQGNPVLNLQPIDINNFDTSQLVRTDGTNPFTGDQSMGGKHLTNVATPVSAGDAVNKAYADALAVDIALTNGVGPLFPNAAKLTFRQEDFYLDTDSSGNPIVNIRGGAGGGSGGGQFGTGISASDFSLSNEWVLNHNLGVTNILWSVYDDQGNAVIPDKVSTHNSNVTYFYFNPAVAGRAVVGGGPIFQSSGGSGSITVGETDGNPPNFTSADTIIFNSNDFYLASSSSGKPIVNFRGTSGGGGGVTDHGALTGLLDDDHPQYILTDGSRKFSGTLKSSLHVERVVVADAFYLTPGSGGEFSKSGNDVILASKDGGISVLAPADGGSITIAAGGDPTFNNNLTGSNLTLTTGFAQGDAGQFLLQGGNSSAGIGGSILILSGSGGGGDGSVQVGTGGNGGFSVSSGTISLAPADLVGGVNVNSAPITNVLNPTNPQDAATKSYVDTTIAASSGSGFYGIFIRESDGNPPTYRNDTIIFDSASFYLNSNSVGKPMVSLRGVTGSGSGLQNVVEDLTPQLGGNLDVNGFGINSPTGDVTFLAQDNVAINASSGNISIQTSGNNASVELSIPNTSHDGIIFVDSDGANGAVEISALDPTGQVHVNAGANIVLNSTGPVVINSSSTFFYSTVDMQGFKIRNLGKPSVATDAARLADLNNGFYGIFIRESDGNPPTNRNDTITFDSTAFYINSDSKGKPMISFRGAITSGSGISAVVQDTTPQLGGNLNGGGFSITNIANPTTAQGAATKNYVDSNLPPGFYGIVLRESDGNPAPIRVDTLTFDSAAFYINSDSIGKPMVSFRGTVNLGLTLNDGVHNIVNKTTVNLNPGGFYLSQTRQGDPVINLRYDKDIYPIFIELGSISNVVVDPFAQYPYTLEYADMDCRTGSATGGFYLIKATNPNGLGVRVGRGQPIPGMDQLAINQTPKRIVPSSGNSVSQGDCVMFTLYGNSAAKHVRITLVAKKP